MMNKVKQRKSYGKRQVSLFLAIALLAGLLPLGTGTKSRAAEHSLRNPRILKTTQEIPPESAGKKELKNPTTDSSGITTWDCIWFGNYWQEDTNGDGKADKNDTKTPIKWRVLSVEGDDVFLVADKNLDCQKYNDTKTDVTWETCTMRSWLNGYGAGANKEGKDYSGTGFLDNAFTSEEREAIKTTNVVNNDNPEYGTEGGNDTSDKVYLLSIEEVTNPVYGFTSSTDGTATRVAVNTAYTAAGGEIGSGYMGSAGSAAYWWLRLPGSSSSLASNVYNNGNVDGYGYDVNNNDYAVRPALHLNLKASSDAISASSWSYAGTVPSDDVAAWDCVWFGNYWQEDTNGDGKADKSDTKTPIKWRVLSVKGDDAFLVADKNLDCQKYNVTSEDVTWETCTMRSWLNGYGAGANKEGKDYSGTGFLDNAFTSGEREAIKTTNVLNNNNQEYGTEGGNNTTDQVYLLSLDEVMNPAYGFTSSTNSTATRVAVNTAYTAAGGEIGSEYMGSAGSANVWWLRSPGSLSYIASDVAYSGIVSRAGSYVHGYFNATRPALHFNLSSISSWSYAGTVTSDGKVEETGAPKPTVTPSPEPGSTQKPQVTSEPGTTSQPGNTEKPSAAPTVTPSPESGNNQKPQVTSEPGMTSQPGSIRKVADLKLKPKKGTVTASWKKTAGAKGYQICYSTSSKWKNKKQKLVSKNKVVIKKLKKRKTYYFRVRAYRLEGKKKVYGSWSGTKKIKIKK